MEIDSRMGCWDSLALDSLAFASDLLRKRRSKVYMLDSEA